MNRWLRFGPIPTHTYHMIIMDGQSQMDEEEREEEEDPNQNPSRDQSRRYNDFMHWSLFLHTEHSPLHPTPVRLLYQRPSSVHPSAEKVKFAMARRQQQQKTAKLENLSFPA